jgi:hypothetical protein
MRHQVDFDSSIDFITFSCGITQDAWNRPELPFAFDAAPP